MRVRSANGGTPYGGKDVTVAVNESVQLKYELKNLGPKPLSNVEVARQIAGDMRIVAQVGELAPAGQTGDTAFFTEATRYIPTLPGVVALATVARARDVNGNTVGPVSDLVYVTASETATDMYLAKCGGMKATRIAPISGSSQMTDSVPITTPPSPSEGLPRPQRPRRRRARSS